MPDNTGGNTAAAAASSGALPPENPSARGLRNHGLTRRSVLADDGPALGEGLPRVGAEAECQQGERHEGPNQEPQDQEPFHGYHRL